MTLQQLRYITMVAEKGTISEAAKELFISQPSLTNAIRELEQEMQVTIFHRTNKGVTITAEGDEFLAYARQILDQVGLMQERYLNVNERNPRFGIEKNGQLFRMSDKNYGFYGYHFYRTSVWI